MPAYQTLANVEAPASDAELRAVALQFVRQLSGTSRPSSANEVAFDQAVDGVSAAAQRLLLALTTSAPRHHDEEARQAQERAHRRFASATGPRPTEHQGWTKLACACPEQWRGLTGQ